jgi:hypothetical protein
MSASAAANAMQVTPHQLRQLLQCALGAALLQIRHPMTCPVRWLQLPRTVIPTHIHVAAAMPHAVAVCAALHECRAEGSSALEEK